MILVVCPNPSVDKWVWTEAFALGGVNRAPRVEAFPGGKGVHVALAATELGEDVALLGIWAGPTGAWVRDEAARRGVAEVCGPMVPGWTRTCLTLKGGGADETELLEPGPQVDEAAIAELLAQFGRHAKGASVAVLSGSLPAGAAPETYARLIEGTRVPVLLDSSGAAFRAGLSAGPRWAKANAAEAADALAAAQRPDQLVEAMAKHAHGATVTLGAEGAVFAQGGKRLHARGSAGAIMSAVGSGDCMAAGIAVALARNMDLAPWRASPQRAAWRTASMLSWACCAAGTWKA